MQCSLPNYGVYASVYLIDKNRSMGNKQEFELSMLPGNAAYTYFNKWISFYY